MKRKKTALLLALVIACFCTGCGPKPEEPWETDEEKIFSGELTVSLPSRWGALEIWAQRFGEAHPGVRVHFVYETEKTYIDPPPGIFFSGEDPAGTELPYDVADRYIQKTAVALSGGEAADIIDLGPMACYKYAKSGLFEDLNALMEKDPAFKREDYYMNIFDALEDGEGHLYGLPPVVRFSFFVLNEYILYRAGIDVEEALLEGADYKGLTDLFWQAAGAGALKPDTGDGKGCYFAPRQNKAFFQELVLPRFIDERTGEARFDTPEFVDYLQQVDGLPFQYTLEQTPEHCDYWPNFLVRPEFDIRESFCEKVPTSLYTLNLALGAGRTLGTTRGVLCEDGEGNVPFSTDMALLAIPKGENTRLAWEFLKFIIEEKEFPEDVWQDSVSDNYEYVHPYNQSLPINRANFQSLGAALYGENFVEAAEPYMERLSSRLGVSRELQSSLMDILAGYWDHHLITAQDCARQLQERAWIYLNE